MKIKLLTLLSIICFLSCNSDKKEKESVRIGQTTKNENSSQSELEKSMERGALVYKDFCNQCHRPKGKGVGRSFPPLANSDYLFNNREASIRGIKYGQKGEITVNGKVYDGVMTPMGLSDKEVADVMNYILNSWGNSDDTMVTVEEVNAIEKTSE